MTKRSLSVLGILVLLAIACGVWYVSWLRVGVVEATEYHNPPPDPDEVLADDKLDDKKPPFDPELVDRRPYHGWLVNKSAAVIALDVPPIKPDVECSLLVLHPSYAAALANYPAGTLLPSVNLLDGKAKQFDDGLYAALDQAYYSGLDTALPSHVQLVKRMYDKVSRDSPAAPFLAAGLELAGVKVNAAAAGDQAQWLARFQSRAVAAKPIGFYTWNETLADCFRFLRFFQHKFEPHELAIPAAIAKALAQDPALLADYRKAMDFYAKLTNPYTCLSVADVVGVPVLTADRLTQLAREKQAYWAQVALFPPSTSREYVLFQKLFGNGLPANTNLMKELVRAIRSGTVNLQPTPGSGWYDHQVYALETMLLPEKGAERDKLLLTRAYKKRMLEAFQVLLTKRRETHVRQLDMTFGTRSAPAPRMQPELRVEPCPSYYLRTARAYAFLFDFLEAAVGKEALQQLHGLRQGGQREPDLHSELRGMRELFYGLYLVSAEDIGLKPALLPDEPVDQERCYQAALAWLQDVLRDKDLAVDTRVAVPIVVDVERGVTRVWATLGVRVANLEADYVRPPRIKPVEGGPWQDVTATDKKTFYIAVDEFAEVELQGLKPLTRDELRAVCDREKTREAIVKALQER